MNAAPKISRGTVNGSPPSPDWPHVSLNDREMFSLESGLWTGKQPPFRRIGVLRNTNFAQGGTLDLSDVALVDVEARSLPRKLLQSGDIIIERSGGGPKQPVGRVAYFEGGATPFSFSNFTSRLRVLRPQELLPRFVHYFLHHFHEEGHTLTLQHNTTGIRNLMFTDYLRTLVPKPPAPEQETIAGVLAKIQRAVEVEDRRIAALKELKAATMAKVFREGVSGESLAETVAGPLPLSWQLRPVGSFLKLSSGRKRPADLAARPSERKTFPVFGGNGIMGYADDYLTEHQTIVIGRVGAYCGEAYLAPPHAWVTDNALFNPEPLPEDVVPGFLAAALRQLRLNQYRRLGAQPLITQGTIYPLMVPLPRRDEQLAIAALEARLDDGAAAARERFRTLQDLFAAALQLLMTGQLRVTRLLEGAEAANA